MEMTIYPTETGDALIYFQIEDDNINEVEQFYVVIGEFRNDISNKSVCFTRSEGSECLGRRGATRVRIRDDDRKYTSIKIISKKTGGTSIKIIS